VKGNSSGAIKASPSREAVEEAWKATVPSNMKVGSWRFVCFVSFLIWMAFEGKYEVTKFTIDKNKLTLSGN
jgi:hypothetical protein